MTRRRRRLVGGDDDRPAGPPDRLAGQRLDARRAARRPRIRTRASRVPAAQNPAIAPEWEDPAGVPIDAILFGGRRSTRRAARLRGVRLGARRLPRRDDGFGDDRGGDGRGRQAAPRPVRDAAVLRLQHGRLLRALAEDRARARSPKLPRIFYVNWFRKGDDGHFLWPGFGENSRVLEWVFRRCEDRVAAVETPIGRVPAPGSTRPRRHRAAPEDVAELLARRRGGMARGAGLDPRAPGDVRPPPAPRIAQAARCPRGAVDRVVAASTTTVGDERHTSRRCSDRSEGRHG